MRFGTTPQQQALSCKTRALAKQDLLRSLYQHATIRSPERKKCNKGLSLESLVHPDAMQSASCLGLICIPSVLETHQLKFEKGIPSVLHQLVET